jgi:hypothetical protein
MSTTRGEADLSGITGDGGERLATSVRRRDRPDAPPARR